MIERLFTRPGIVMTDPKLAFYSHHFGTVEQVIQAFGGFGVDPMTGFSSEIIETFVFGWMYTSLGGEFDAEQPFFRATKDAAHTLGFAKRLGDAELISALELVLSSTGKADDAVEKLRALNLADYAQSDVNNLIHGPL